MITEDYVSFEVAKLLKEKGFDGECDYLYVNGNIVRAQGFRCNWNKGETIFTDYKNECSAPTIQMAMKWLREEKRLYINVWADPKDFENDDFSTIYRMHVYNGTSNNGTREFSKYEEACENGIRYCLENLI